MNKKCSARQDGKIIEIEFPESGGYFDAWLYINAEPEDKRIHFQGKLLFEQSMLVAIRLTDLTGNGDGTGLTSQGYGTALVGSALAFFQHYFTQKAEITPEVEVRGELSDAGDESDSSHDRRVAFWNKMGFSVQGPADHYSGMNAVLGKNGCGTSPIIDPESFLSGEDVRSMSHIQPSDVSAAVNLYEKYLKDGCKQLLTLNTYLMKTERKEMKKQTLYHLGWTIGISSLVVIVSYLVAGINIFTAVGLLAAYFIAQFLHNKFSPDVVMPKEKDELFELNDKLRNEILAVEEQSRGNLFRLLEVTGLEEKAQSNGLKIEKGQIHIYQLDGNGLYQYLDAINLLIEHREQLDALIQH